MTDVLKAVWVFSSVGAMLLQVTTSFMNYPTMVIVIYMFSAIATIVGAYLIGKVR